MRKILILGIAVISVIYIICGLSLTAICALDVRALKTDDACLFSDAGISSMAATRTPWYGIGYTITDFRPLGSSERHIIVSVNWAKWFLIPLVLDE